MGGYANSWYQFASGPPAGFAPTGTIQFLRTRYSFGTGADTFPDFALINIMYGVPDIGYTLGETSTPEPFSLGLTGLGVALLLMRHKGTRSPV